MTSRDSSSIPSGSSRQFDLSLSTEDDRPVPRLVNLIVREALNNGVQEVHLDAGTTTARFFTGGEWAPFMKLPAAVLPPLINRIRVMASLDRIKGNNRQEGTIEFIVEGAAVAARVVVQFTEAGDEEVYLHLPSRGKE